MERKCILCGCKDHKLLGCNKYLSKRCSCFAKWVYLSLLWV